MLEDGSEELENNADNNEFPEESRDVMPEEDVEPPDSQEFENLMDEAAEGLADEDIHFDNEDLGDYEDMGDFDYLEEADVDKEDMSEFEDGEMSPDSMGEDIGEIAEEIGEIAEEGEAIIAALL